MLYWHYISLITGGDINMASPMIAWVQNPIQLHSGINEHSGCWKMDPDWFVDVWVLLKMGDISASYVIVL